jgi:hypothetical protein
VASAESTPRGETDAAPRSSESARVASTTDTVEPAARDEIVDDSGDTSSDASDADVADQVALLRRRLLDLLEDHDEP